LKGEKYQILIPKGREKKKYLERRVKETLGKHEILRQEKRE